MGTDLTGRAEQRNVAGSAADLVLSDGREYSKRRTTAPAKGSTVADT